MRPTTRAMEFYKVIFFSLITQIFPWDITLQQTPPVYLLLLSSITLFSHHQFLFLFVCFCFGFVCFFLGVMDNYKPLHTAEQRAGLHPRIQTQRDSRAVRSSGSFPAIARPKMRCSWRAGQLSHSGVHGHTQLRGHRTGRGTPWLVHGMLWKTKSRHAKGSVCGGYTSQRIICPRAPEFHPAELLFTVCSGDTGRSFGILSQHSQFLHNKVKKSESQIIKQCMQTKVAFMLSK